MAGDDDDEKVSIEITGEPGRITGPDGRTFTAAKAKVDLDRLAKELKGKRVTGMTDFAWVYRLLYGLARVNELNGHTDRGGQERERRGDPDAEHVAWCLAEIERDPAAADHLYKLAARWDGLNKLTGDEIKRAVNRVAPRLKAPTTKT